MIEVYLQQYASSNDRTYNKRVLRFYAPNGSIKKVLAKIHKCGFAKNPGDSFNERSSSDRILVKFGKKGSLVGHVGFWTITIYETNAEFSARNFLTEVVLKPQQH